MSEVILLSGGYDSALLLFIASSPVALFVDYGQAAASNELVAARKLCEVRGCKLIEARCELNVVTMNGHPGGIGPRVVAGRNAALISLGINTAINEGAQEVWIGAQAGDAANYPDCKADFINAFGRISKAAYGVDVKAPLIMMPKFEMRMQYKRLVPPGVTWSCYEPIETNIPCGRCNSCMQER